MDVNRLKKLKKEQGYTNQQIADLSGVPLGTVQKIFGSATKEPRRETYLAIARVLEPTETYGHTSGTSMVRETVLELEASPRDIREKKQGEYTLEDYYALPDDRRAELIDGVIYDMTAPAWSHQDIAGEIFHQLKKYKEENKLDCFPGIAPIDVQLDRDNRTMVQPDVIILCDKRLNRNRVVYGAPEFVLEVLSPSTRSKDQLIKLNKYYNAGCKEVWIVDPESRNIMVYDFTSDRWPDIYTFDDEVPVAISGGKCRIDFVKVRDSLDELLKTAKENDELWGEE